MISSTDQRLRQAFHFTPADLAANRVGILTPAQKRLLAKTRRLRGCGQKAAYLALAGSILFFVSIALWLAPLNSPDFQAAAPFLAIGAAIFIGFFLLALFIDAKRGHALKTEQINTATGEATAFLAKAIKSKGGRVIGTDYSLKIGPTRLRLATQAQFEAFEPGLTYTVFYIKNPPVPIILSAEWLEAR